MRNMLSWEGQLAFYRSNRHAMVCVYVVAVFVALTPCCHYKFLA